MLKYIKKIFVDFIISLIIIGVVIVNWQWPIYNWFGETTLYRFIWLGIFFVLLDILIEIILHSSREVRLMFEAMSFSKNLRKLPDSFYIISDVLLPNNLIADHVVIGSSGIWLIEVKDSDGHVEFNGDDLVQGGVILKGFMVRVLEKSFALAGVVKKKIGRDDFKVAPVIAFSSSKASVDPALHSVRGVFVASRQETVPLIENTDFQIIDKNTIEEAYQILKNKS